MELGDVDNKPHRDQDLGRTDAGNEGYRSRRSQRSRGSSREMRSRGSRLEIRRESERSCRRSSPESRQSPSAIRCLTRPGYGASSSLRNSHNQAGRVSSVTALSKCCHLQRPRITTTADSLTRNSSGGGFSTRTRTGKREARCTQFSVLCTSGRPGIETANHVRIGSHAETDAVHHARKAHVRFRQDIDVGPHARSDMLQLAFAEVGDRPPGARVNQHEHLLTGVRVGAFGNREIGDPRIEWRVDPAVVEVVARGLHGGALSRRAG